MPTLNQEGSQLTTASEITIITAVTTNNTFVFGIDTVEMLNADIIRVLIKTKLTDGDALQVLYPAVYAHFQGAPNKQSLPIPSNVEVQVTLQGLAGTHRTYKWTFLELE